MAHSLHLALDVRGLEAPEELAAYYDLRWRVWREPWTHERHSERHSERNRREGEAVHLGWWVADRLVGKALRFGRAGAWEHLASDRLARPSRPLPPHPRLSPGHLQEPRLHCPRPRPRPALRRQGRRTDLGFRRDAKIVGVAPTPETLGIAGAMLVKPGVPDQSVLLRRVTRRGEYQMPPTGATPMDSARVQLRAEWIRPLPHAS